MGEEERGDVTMRLASPEALLFVAPMLAVLVYLLARTRRTLAPSRRRLYLASAGLAGLAAALAALGLEIAYTRDATTVVLVVDRSRSTATGDAQIEARLGEAQRALGAMRPDDRVGLVVVGTEAETVLAPSPRALLPRAQADVPREASDLEAGIRHALADIPEASAARIVLLSDGLETTGDAVNAASAASSRGVSVDVVPIERAPSPSSPCSPYARRPT